MTESPFMIETSAFATGCLEIFSLTIPSIPCEKIGVEKEKIHNEQIINRKCLRKEGFLRIIICWFFDRNRSIEKSYLIRTKDNRIIMTSTQKLFFLKIKLIMAGCRDAINRVSTS